MNTLSVRRFPSSFRLDPHNVSGIPATLWLTMWTECEEYVSLNEDAYLVVSFTLTSTLLLIEEIIQMRLCTGFDIKVAFT